MHDILHTYLLTIDHEPILASANQGDFFSWKMACNFVVRYSQDSKRLVDTCSWPPSLEPQNEGSEDEFCEKL